jgi:hypothetical protein
MLIAGCFIGILTLDAHAVATKQVKVTIANAGPRANVTIRSVDGATEKTEQTDDRGVAYFWVDTDKAHDVQVVTQNGTFYEARNQRLNGEVALDTKTMTQHGDPNAKMSSSLMSKTTVNRFFPQWMQKNQIPGPTWETRVFAGWSLSELVGLRGGGAVNDEIQGVALKNGPTFGGDIAYWTPSGIGLRMGYQHANSHIKQGTHVVTGTSGTNPGSTISQDLLSITPLLRCTCFAFDPYVGVGLLIARTSITNGADNETEQTFGWQAVAGGTYRFTKILGAFVEGRYNRVAYDNKHMNLGGAFSNFPADATLASAQVLVGLSAQFDSGVR